MRIDSYDTQFRLEDSYWWFVVRRRLINVLVDIYCLEQTTTLLDYGCGSGSTLIGLDKEKIREHIGYDRSNTALELLRRRGFRGTDQWQTVEKEGPFGVVLICDVFEHVQDEHFVMARALSVLKPGGIVIATVPALNALWSGEDHVSHHLRRYTKRQFQTVFSGTRLERISYFNFILLPFIYVNIKLRNFFKPATACESDITPLWPPINSLLKSIFLFETRLLPRLSMPIGASLFAVARKPK